MNVLTNRIFAFALGGCAIVLASCGGGASIPAQHPGATPTPTNSTSPSSHPSTSPTATSSATATATATATPTAKPTATPTATPTGTPTPTPTPTSTAPACATPPPDPNTTQVPILGTGPAQIITVPCYGDFTGTATIPAGTTIGGPTDAIISVTSDDGAFKVPDDPAAGTRLLSTAISVSNTVTLGNPNIPTVVTSPTKILKGHVYEAELYLLLFAGGNPTPETKYYQLNLKPKGHSISFNVTNPVGNSFPSGPVAYVIIYENK